MLNKKPVAFIGHRLSFDGLLEVTDALGIEVLGIYDKNFQDQTEYRGLPLLGSEDNISDSDVKNVNFFMTSFWAGHVKFHGTPSAGSQTRQERILFCEQRQLNLINLINPSSFVHPTVNLGKNIFVGNGVNIRAYTTVGDYSFIDHMNAIAPDVNIGRNCIILPNCFISSFVDLHDNVLIGGNSTLINGGDGVTVIGENSKVNAGSIVYKSIDPNKIVTHVGKVLSSALFN